MSENIGLGAALAAVDRIEDRRVRNMTAAALMATVARLTRRKEPIEGPWPVDFADFVDCLRGTFGLAVDGEITTDRLMRYAMALAPCSMSEACYGYPGLIEEMLGYAFDHIGHLAYLAAGNEPTPWE